MTYFLGLLAMVSLACAVVIITSENERGASLPTAMAVITAWCMEPSMDSRRTPPVLVIVALVATCTSLVAGLRQRRLERAQRRSTD